MAEKTPDNFNYGNMSAEYRMKYKKMMEEENKKREKKKKEKSKLQTIADKLYGGSK